MKTKRILVLLAMAGAFANPGFAQMSGSGQPKAGPMSDRSATSAVASTNGMGATTTPGGGLGGTNMSQMGTTANPQGGTNHRQIIAPNSGQRSMSPGMRPSGSQTGLPADMQSMMQRFQADRDAFIAKQKTIETQLKGATEEQRQTLLMQMQGQMQEWKEQHAMMRQQMLQQVEQMKQQMMEQQRLMNHVTAPGAGNQQGSGKPGRPTGMDGH